MIAPTPYFSDRGCHVRIYEEALALTKLGHEVCIVTYHLGRDMPGVRVVRTPHVPWYDKLEAGPSWHKPYLDALLLWKSLAVVRSFRPHLIHAHLHEGALIGSVLKRLLRIPLLFDYQGSLSGESLNHGFFGDIHSAEAVQKAGEFYRPPGPSHYHQFRQRAAGADKRLGYSSRKGGQPDRRRRYGDIPAA